MPLITFNHGELTTSRRGLACRGLAINLALACTTCTGKLVHFWGCEAARRAGENHLPPHDVVLPGRLCFRAGELRSSLVLEEKLKNSAVPWSGLLHLVWDSVLFDFGTMGRFHLSQTREYRPDSETAKTCRMPTSKFLPPASWKVRSRTTNATQKQSGFRCLWDALQASTPESSPRTGQKDADGLAAA